MKDEEHIRTKISDEHLENSLRIENTGIKPNILALVSKKQCQTSHRFYFAVINLWSYLNVLTMFSFLVLKYFMWGPLHVNPFIK